MIPVVDINRWEEWMIGRFALICWCCLGKINKGDVMQYVQYVQYSLCLSTLKYLYLRKVESLPVQYVQYVLRRAAKSSSRPAF